MADTKRIRSRIAPLVLTTSTLVLAGPTTARAEGVTFQDVALDEGSGLAYHRVESASEAIFANLRKKPLFTLADLVAAPDSSRGMPGVALLDFDRDGDLDIYVTNGPGAANSLFANQLAKTGELTFRDVAQEAGVGAAGQDSTGVCYGDLDNDGDPDLLVLGNREANRLFENRADGTFREITDTAGFAGQTTSSASCAIGDVNGDGLLDIAIANAFDLRSRLATLVEPYAASERNQLFVNQGDNVFADVSEASGILDIYLPEGPERAGTITWGIALVDVDLDGDLDLLHADDQAAVPTAAAGGVDRGYNQLFVNDGKGRFTNVTAERGLDRTGDWMGLAFGDFNHDGRLDFFSTNFGNHGGAALLNSTDFIALDPRDTRWFLQRPDTTFADSLDAGLLNTPFGWGTSALDYDNDGDTDLVFHGGFDAGLLVITAPGVIFDNDGQANFRRDRAALAGSRDHLRRNVRGVAVGDLDGNGFVDVVSVSNFDYPTPIELDPTPRIGGEFDDDAVVLRTFLPLDPDAFGFDTDYVPSGLPKLPDGTLSVELNQGETAHGWVRVELFGTVGLTTGGRASRDGLGAVVRGVPRGGRPVLLPVLGGSSVTSQDSGILTLGLGDADHTVVDVLWPGGTHNRYFAKAGQHVVLPEIPCSFDDPDLGFVEYLGCIDRALDELEAAGAVTRGRKARLLAQSVRAYLSGHSRALLRTKGR